MQIAAAFPMLMGRAVIAREESRVISFSVPHYRQWRFIEEMHDLDAFFQRVFDTLLNGKGRALKHGDIFHAIDGRGDLMVSFLVQNQTVFSSYPFADRGHSWPMRVQGSRPDANPHEAIVYGECEGSPVALFDTLYFRNHVLYGEGATLEFLVNGLAYSLEAADGEAAHVTLHDDDPRDELRFVAPVTEARQARFWDIPLTVYTVALPLGEGQDLPLSIYTPSAAQDGAFRPGAMVRGHAWLFGHVPPRDDDAAGG